ncbi:MAG TPA: glycosyltransferase [Polyangiaceae bacterium]|nr:glycosyltransferase [Polyangiaceae bacterium]
MSEPLTLLCAAKLFPNLLERYLLPLTLSDDVGKVVVVRHEPLVGGLAKVENVSFGAGGTAISMLRMLTTVDRVLRRERIDWVMGFNPVPWGALGAAAAARHGVPVSLSFIGMDYKQIMRPLAWPLWQAVRRAQLVTVTGERMLRGLVARGLPEARIRILPHTVDTERFKPSSDPPDLDVISVGQLIPRKRMDVLIDAVADLKERGVSVRAGILGEGPLKEELGRRIRERNVEDRVTLLGFRNDVEVALRRARLFALVSDWEGVPFAMIEAMSTGLVPIVTDVGTIADWIVHEKNGHIVPVGDPRALSRSIERLLSDDDHREELRTAALGIRSSISLQNGVAFWRSAFATARS